VLIRAAVLISIAIAPAASMAWFGPSTYEDCVLKNMRGVTSDLAAAQIRNACREKFRDRGQSVPKGRALRPDELAKLTARAGVVAAAEPGSFLAHFDAQEGSVFAGTLHNGNASLTITEVVFTLSGKTGTTATSQAYSASFALAPLSVVEFKVKIAQGEFKEGFTWAIQSARGY